MTNDSAATSVHRAGPDDAAVVAQLLHDFNTEFETATPGVSILSARLRALLAGSTTVAYLAATPAAGVALVSLRANVWYEGQVALLDELYVTPERRGHGLGSAMIGRLLADAAKSGVSAVEINVDEGDVDAQRFYERHGFTGADPDTGDRAFYYYREL
jgi:GNAT superfamily N-acetyltransferase